MRGTSISYRGGVSRLRPQRACGCRLKKLSAQLQPQEAIRIRRMGAPLCGGLRGLSANNLSLHQRANWSLIASSSSSGTSRRAAVSAPKGPG